MSNIERMTVVFPEPMAATIRAAAADRVLMAIDAKNRKTDGLSDARSGARRYQAGRSSVGSWTALGPL